MLTTRGSHAHWPNEERTRSSIFMKNLGYHGHLEDAIGIHRLCEVTALASNSSEDKETCPVNGTSYFSGLSRVVDMFESAAKVLVSNSNRSYNRPQLCERKTIRRPTELARIRMVTRLLHVHIWPKPYKNPSSGQKISRDFIKCNLYIYLLLQNEKELEKFLWVSFLLYDYFTEAWRLVDGSRTRHVSTLALLD